MRTAMATGRRSPEVAVTPVAEASPEGETTPTVAVTPAAEATPATAMTDVAEMADAAEATPAVEVNAAAEVVAATDVTALAEVTPIGEPTPGVEATPTNETPPATAESHALAAAEEPAPHAIEMLTAADVETLRAHEIAATAPAEPAGDVSDSAPETHEWEAPTIDLAQLEEASMGIPSLREALLGAFLSEIRPRLDRLTRALNAGDARRFQSEAHGLNILSGTIGARACAETFEDLEGRGERSELEGAVVVLRNAYVEVIRAEEQAAKLREERMAA
jgi:HPt (histidine-containing phosphotransfer) domain-containing protein